MLNKRAISAQLLELERDDVSAFRKQDLNNQVSVGVLRVTTKLDQAEHLLTEEKRKIKSRGLNPIEYLFGDGTIVQDILRTFYQSKEVTKNDKEVLTGDYTLSEMMMMLGTFIWFAEERETQHEKARRNYRKVNQKINRNGIYAFAKFSTQEEEDLFAYSEMLRITKLEETRMFTYLAREVKVIFEAIAASLGISLKDMDEAQMKSIYKESLVLCRSRKEIACFFARRNQKMPVVNDDVLFFRRMGEKEANLSDIVLPEEQEKKKIYQK